MKLGAMGAAIVLGATLVPFDVQARVQQDERYAPDLAWNAAIRMLRVDMGFKILERDRDAGFILFTYRDGSHHSPGALEIIPTRVEGISGTRVIVQLSQMPTYAERHIATR